MYKVCYMYIAGGNRYDRTAGIFPPCAAAYVFGQYKRKYEIQLLSKQLHGLKTSDQISR